MDKNVTMDRRFSLNMTHLPNPIAESTCVNLNGTTTSSGRSSAANHFRWGGCPISPKNRSNSSTNFNSTNAAHKSKSTVTSPQRARMNLSKIDPRIYADVQSRGLVSRIVQYHENGSRLNRSMSASNLYGKPGHSSISQLQKSELPYRATQQNVLMTRIAPPKKSVFYGNTLSSLLRSNSVISLQKSDEELSCENRPILHPPPTESDLAPTRSVLDVLKEISRKRINSDDSNGINDTNKKYCSRDCNDAPHEQSILPADLRNLSVHGGLAAPTMSAPVQSFKRQREPIVTPQQHLLQYTQNSVASATTITGAIPPMQAQRSPEQIAKKRICSYNNDITSSLSSSLIHANKRKFYEKKLSPIHNSPPSRAEEYETQKSKILRQQTDLRFQQLTNSLSCNTPITPMPTTPLYQSDAMPATLKSSDNRPESSAETTEVVKRTVSEPPLATSQIYSKPQKPKITLFNRDYNVSSSNNVNGTDEETVKNWSDVDDGECADIQFVKPKKSTAIVNKKNPLIERTQKSKLAMMLSGLRGEIYQGEERDEVDKISNKPQGKYTEQSNHIANKEISDGKVATTGSSTSNTTTTTTVTNFVMKTPTPAATISSALGATTSADKASAKLTPKSTSIATSVSSTPTTITSSTLGGFKLTPTAVTASSATTTNVSPTATAKTTSPLVGLKLTPQKPALNFGVNTSTAAPNLNFSATTAASTSSNKSVEGTIATGVGAVPQLQGFSFGSTAKSTLSAPVATTATLTTAAITEATVITSASNIGESNFGSYQKNAAATTENAAASTTTAAPTFGSFAKTVALTSTSASTATTKPVFAFGGTPTSTSTAMVKPSFNFGGSATPAATTAAPIFGAVASSTFTFGANTNPSTAAAGANSATSQATTTATQPSMVFGSGPANSAFTLATSSNSQPFAFGAAATTTQSATPTATKFSFGSAIAGSTSTEAPTSATTNLFAFGGQKSTAATTTATATTATPFAFGAATQNSGTTVTATSASANKPVFNFGGAGENAANPLSGAAKTNSSSGNNLFAFSGTSTASENKLFGNNTAGANNPASTQPGAFTFGAVAAQAATSPFGVASATPTASTFGVTNVPSTTPFAFGASNANKPAVASSAAPTTSSTSGGFSFGVATAAAANANNTATTNIFGSASAVLNNQAAQTANPGITKPAFNFGGATTSTNDAAKSIFGGAATNAASNTSSTNTFGSLAAANSNPGNKTFSFGSSAASGNNASPNPFAAAASKPAAGGFSFNANTTSSKPAVVASTLGSNSATPFAFSATTTGGAATTATAAPFSFGGTNQVATANKTFTFGSSNTASAGPTVNANIFGSGAHSAQQTSVTPFSFSAGISTGATPAPGAAPTAAANIFAPPAAPGAVSGAAGDRPIRRATRRLQKT